MKLRIFIESCFFLSVFSGLCMPNEPAFISMNGDCRYPAVASEGDTVYLTWLTAAGGGDAGIFFRRSTDGGKVWSADQRISGEGSSCYPPTIAVLSGVVHAAWVDYNDRIEGELYYNRSFDGGVTWERNRILVDDANNTKYPLIGCKGENVYMIWQDMENKTFFKSSHNKGKSWGETILLAKLGKHSCYCYPPALCLNDNEISVIWADVYEEKGFHVLIKGIPLNKTGTKVVSTVVRRKSTDAGNTWGDEQILAKTKVTKEAKDEIDNPAVLSIGSQAYLFWLEKSNNKLGEIFFANLDLKKERFPITGKNLIPSDNRSPKRPCIVFDNEKNINCAWTSFLGGKSIVNYCKCNLEGKLVIPKQELTTDSSRYHHPVMATTSSGLLNIFWFDEPKTGWSKLYFKTSKDNGLTWGAFESPEKDAEN